MELETERLRAANHWIKERVEGKINEKEFVSLAKRIPTLLLQNGLILTVAYLQKRGGAGEKEILQYLIERLRDSGLVGDIGSDFLDYLLNRSPSEIPLLLDEALASAEALKIIAEARLEPK